MCGGLYLFILSVSAGYDSQRTESTDSLQHPAPDAMADREPAIINIDTANNMSFNPVLENGAELVRTASLRCRTIVSCYTTQLTVVVVVKSRSTGRVHRPLSTVSSRSRIAPRNDLRDAPSSIHQGFPRGLRRRCGKRPEAG